MNERKQLIRGVGDLSSNYGFRYIDELDTNFLPFYHAEIPGICTFARDKIYK